MTNTNVVKLRKNRHFNERKLFITKIGNRKVQIDRS